MRSSPRLPSYNPPGVAWLIFVAICFPLGGRTQAEHGDYLHEIAAAQKEVVECDALTIRRLDLGAAKLGKSRFTAVVKNRSASTQTLGLDLRAVPGLWLLNRQAQFTFTLQPQEEKTLEAEYQLDHMTPQAWLRVRFSLLSSAPGNAPWPAPFFDKKYYLGKANPADDEARFTERHTEHFRIYYFPSSPAARDIETIASQRESAYAKVSAMLQVSYPEPILLCFYPDSETKTRETGHTGAGLSYDNIMVEIYNQQTRLNPYHELTHTLAGRLGDPPALFKEGLAVYVAESMGSDALKDLGSPGKKIDEAVVANRQKGKFIPLEKLFTFTNIGPEESQPVVSYAEAASFVKFLVQKYGLEKFRLTYKSLQNDSDPAVVAKNQQTFHSIYGKLPAAMEQPWLSGLPPATR